jgi:hypothetical protein
MTGHMFFRADLERVCQQVLDMAVESMPKKDAPDGFSWCPIASITEDAEDRLSMNVRWVAELQDDESEADEAPEEATAT